MNAKKGKNKPRSNKPPNPNPPQKDEQIDVEKTENLLEETVESAQKSEDRVPEIISEVVTPPVVDPKDKEDDSPKKPKRNRGKKKKHEKDDDTQEEQISENVEAVQLEIIEVETQEVIAGDNVTPSARKKKNKNKKAADPEVKQETGVSVEEKKLDIVDTVEKEDSTHQDAGDQENKGTKKKNKKKKQRNDSERSDAKAEEISCTSAFQKLLKEEKRDSKVSESETKVDVVPTEINKGQEFNISSFLQELEKVEETKDATQETAKTQTEGTGKGKKKNKKDKKEPPKGMESEMEASISLVTAIKPILKDDSILDDKKEEPITELVSSPEAPKFEEVIKPKAKIAKPVERKRKGKGDVHTEETSLEKSTLEQESENKDVKIPEPIAGDKVGLIDIPKETEAVETTSTESKLPEANVEENKQDTTKPTHKKRKGKGNKQSEEIIELTESKETKIEEGLIPVLPQETVIQAAEVCALPEMKPDVDNEQKLVISADISEAVKEKDSKQETVKPDEKKKKGKKDPKKQEPLSEPSLEATEQKHKEFTTPEIISESILGLPTKTEAEEMKIMETIPSESKVEIEDKKASNKSLGTKQKGKKDATSVQELKEVKDQVQECKEKEAITEPLATLGSAVLVQSDIFKNIPFMPEPIENIQTKQEMIGDDQMSTQKIGIEEFKDTSLISPPESGMGKKRKKSPKPPKRDQIKTPEPKVEDVSKTADPEVDDSDDIFILPLTEDILIAPAVTLSEPQIKQEETKATDIVEPAATELLQETDDKTPFETKSKKKRKKSPKLPLDQKTSDIPDPLKKESGEKQASETIETKSETPKDTQPSLGTEVKADIFYDFPSDVEISSLIVDEPEGAAGFTPDIIQSPRATSQDLIDDNNNMFIREITAVEEVKLQIPTDIPNTPLIKGSGSTPLETPENILVGIRISQVEVDTNKNEAEKTDIKSKMMEVNQDMEELRLSIERSLAELTAIEKSEGVVEKQFEEKKTATEEFKPAEAKISMPSEIIAMSLSSKKEEPATGTQLETVAPSPASVPSETNVPPKTSMFFDKELKDTDIELKTSQVQQEKVPVADVPKLAEHSANVIALPAPPVPPMRKDKSLSKERDNKDTKTKSTDDSKPSEAVPITETQKTTGTVTETATPPVCPARKDNKNKGKNKKKGKQEGAQMSAQTESVPPTTESKDPPKETKQEEKTEKKPETTQDKGKQQSDITKDSGKTTDDQESESKNAVSEFEPIENFEDAMTSSADDINKTFEMIANEASRSIEASHVNPEIKIVAPVEDTKRDRRDEKINPVSQPKNLLGHPDIPVRLNKTDYKKEKNKTPNAISAKVKIKDAVEIEAKKQTRDTQTDNIRKFLKSKSIDESFSSVTNENDEFVYKYSFRRVFLQSACHVCKKDLKQARVPCNFCNLVFYCNAKHKDEDWAQHQGLCFAISTIVHLKDQKHIYADAKNVTGQDYRLLRMQMIVSCERVLKRKLSPWEQEALLYPRMCADAACREWRQGKLQDCDGCGQISYCASSPHHLPKSHQRWCKSYSLYQKLVCHQQTKGRLEPKLPGKVMEDHYQIPEKINEALASMYEEKIDMNDIQYAALTQIATAPLTAAYCHQTYAATGHANGTYKKSSCTVHIVGGELQFEADALNKWEVFFLHLRPQLQDLRVVMVGADLNPSNLPLELLGKVKLCETCRMNKRRVMFSFQDKTTYHDYRASDEFITPDIVCAFNPSIKRSSMYNGKDPWPKTINCILKQKVPFLVSSYTQTELQRDLARVKECSEVDSKVIIEPRLNSFASVRPDRNFITDDEMPLLFKNYCFALVCGVN